MESSCAGSEQQSREQYVQEIGSDAGIRVQVQTDGDELGEEEGGRLRTSQRAGMTQACGDAVI